VTLDFLSDRFVGCLVGMGIGDAMGQAADGMTPYDVMVEYRFVDGFFAKPGHDSGKTGNPFGLAAACSKALLGSGLRLSHDHMKEALSARKGWALVEDCVSDMSKGKAFGECGREYDLPDFLPFMVPIALVAAAKATKDELLAKACEGISSGFCKLPQAKVAALSLCFVIRDSVNDFDNVSNPHELFDGKNSLFRRLIPVCKSAEPTSGMQEKDRLSSRMEYVISGLRKRMSIREFVLSNGSSTCAEVASSCLFCFASAPENFESVSKVASLGGKASLCSCLVSALVGAYSGAIFMPKEMKEGLKKESVMEGLAKELATAAWQATQPGTGG